METSLSCHTLYKHALDPHPSIYICVWRARVCKAWYNLLHKCQHIYIYTDTDVYIFITVYVLDLAKYDVSYKTEVLLFLIHNLDVCMLL